MKTPNEVLSYFIESLEQEKQFEFNMNNWFSNETDSFITPYEVENTCGTSACIAGTVSYRLNPKSMSDCEETIQKWIGLPEDLGDYTNEHECVCSALDDIFTSAYLYGEEELDDISKEQALTVLNKLLKESHDTWASLHNSAFQIKGSNINEIVENNS